MTSSIQVAQYALRTLAAKNKPSVSYVFEGVVYRVAQELENGNRAYYIGVKNTDVILTDFLNLLEKNNFFVHTYDNMARHGRAIDLNLINPITGKYMTGSSSGTAINVFNGINDVGIGTDGGGSVLAPALSLNLFGMMSPLIDAKNMDCNRKISTDGILFRPSIGFISKEYSIINEILNVVLKIDESSSMSVLFAKSPHKEHEELNKLWDDFDIDSENMALSYEGSSREAMILELSKIDFSSKIVVCCEGPIDLYGYGDSVMGHYDSQTRQEQAKGHKYYLKVANMLGLSAFVVPSKYHARGYLILYQSCTSAIAYVQELIKHMSFKRSDLEESYFDVTKEVMEDIL